MATATASKADEFKFRLHQASNDSPDIPPYGHGQQVYIARKLKVTQEAVRKWFAGESRPRASKMRELAKILGVDEAWLALGVLPEMDRREKRAHGLKSDGAVHLMYGMFSLAGGICAFPSERDPRKADIDFYTIIRGTQMPIHVSTARKTDDGRLEFVVPHDYEGIRCIGVIPGDMAFHILDLDEALIEKHKTHKSGQFAVTVESRNGSFATGRDEWRSLRNLGEL
jgi:transcriptional regulator with XRE-family HTH domain